ncbi:HET-domain-containing protein, partial [Lophiostoma macrostomum CBS 122681]
PSLYRPLRPETKEIRVVEVAPSESFDQPLHLTLRHTSLIAENRLKYEALSYCWGDIRQTVGITLVGDNASSVEFQISSNLERAIKRIRQPKEIRVFWIDLLCINQSDTNERGRQVALMCDVYALAESVSVWLGELDEIIHTEEDLDVYQAMEHAYESDKSRDKLHVPANDENGVRNWFNDRVFLRPWFQRVWV